MGGRHAMKAITGPTGVPDLLPARTRSGTPLARDPSKWGA